MQMGKRAIWLASDNYGSVLSRTVLNNNSSPCKVIRWGMFWVTRGTKRELPNSSGDVLMARSVSISPLSSVSSSNAINTSVGLIWLKLNCKGSKAVLTLRKFWHGRLHPGLDFSGLYWNVRTIPFGLLYYFYWVILYRYIVPAQRIRIYRAGPYFGRAPVDSDKVLLRRPLPIGTSESCPIANGKLKRKALERRSLSPTSWLAHRR